MSWQQCIVCNSGIKPENSSEFSKNKEKMTQFHEPSSDRCFRITVNRKCSPNQSGAFGEFLQDEASVENKSVDFYVDFRLLVKSCPFFEKFSEKKSIEIVTNCISTSFSPSISSSSSSNSSDCCCQIEASSPITAPYFHAFLEAVYPSVYNVRPVSIRLENVVPVLDVLAHFPCEPLLTNCERFLMNINIAQLDAAMMVKLLKVGLNVSLDHKILSRILCVCLMNSAKLADVSQELIRNVGAVFAQAFVANASKSFRHVKPIEQDSVCAAVRDLIRNNASDQSNSNQISKMKKKKKGCDHNEESFECILCFDTRCGKCKGEASYCNKALDNFLYEVRQQLYPQTYRIHLDRELLREDSINNYILRHQLLPLPNQQF